MLDGDLPLKGPYFRRNQTSIVLQSKNTRKNRNQHIQFAQKHFLRPHLPQIHAETFSITRDPPIMLIILSIMLCCTAQKFTYYA